MAQKSGPSTTFLAIVLLVIGGAIAMYMKTQSVAHNHADVHGTRPIVGGD